MTTIILVSIGILIAAVAAVMVIFYGGDAFSGSTEKADAARLVGEGVQMQAAVQAFRAQEDRMPGLDGTGVDSVALWDLRCKDYLTSVPRGINKSEPQIDCTKPRPVAADKVNYESPWKIDYNYGIARSVIGNAQENGSDSQAMKICKAARKQIGLTGEPLRCDAAGISNREPCCIMSADDAAAS